MTIAPKKKAKDPFDLPSIKVNDEHSFKPPRAPEDRSEILFSGLDKKQQYWRSNPEELHVHLGLPQMYFDWHENTLINQENTIYDDQGFLTHLSIEDTQSLVEIRDRELHRRLFGIHFMNNGEIEYLTGNNYFFLVYYKIPSVGNPGFRKFQRDCFYIIEIAKNDPNILGAYFAKAKKTGLSHIICSVFLNESTSIRARGFGVMNKSQDEANDLNINYYKLALDELPPIMRPNVSHTNLSEVRFSHPVIKYTGTAKSIEKQLMAARNKPLNTWIFSAPTKLQVKFDGPQMYYIHLDEFPKWKVSPRQIFGKVTETVKLQQTIIGKIWITSYPPEEDGQGFEEGKKIYYDSKLTTIKAGTLGRTKSGLICHFVSALDATDGTFDIYGNADRAEALRRNQAERDMCTTSTELQEKIRQYCRDEEECWRSGGNGSTFDNNHLSAGKQSLEKRERAGERLYTTNDMEWKEGMFSHVRIRYRDDKEMSVDKQAGWFRVYENYSDVHYNRCYKDHNGLWTPPVDSKFIMAVDPPEYKSGDSVKRDPSDAAICVMNFQDMQRNTQMGRVASKVVVMQYTGRRDDPDTILEDVIKCLFLYSCYVIIEANKQWMITRMKKLGLQNFLLVRLADNRIVPYVIAEAEGKENFPITTTTEVIETYCRLGNSYLRWPPSSEEIDYVMCLKSLTLFDHLMRFNPNKTKEFDEAVAFLLCLLAMDAFSAFADTMKELERKNAFIGDVFEMITDYV